MLQTSTRSSWSAAEWNRVTKTERTEDTLLIENRGRINGYLQRDAADINEELMVRREMQGGGGADNPFGFCAAICHFRGFSGATICERTENTFI